MLFVVFFVFCIFVFWAAFLLPKLPSPFSTHFLKIGCLLFYSTIVFKLYHNPPMSKLAFVEDSDSDVPDIEDDEPTSLSCSGGSSYDLYNLSNDNTSRTKELSSSKKKKKRKKKSKCVISVNSVNQGVLEPSEGDSVVDIINEGLATSTASKLATHNIMKFLSKKREFVVPPPPDIMVQSDEYLQAFAHDFDAPHHESSSGDDDDHKTEEADLYGTSSNLAGLPSIPLDEPTVAKSRVAVIQIYNLPYTVTEDEVSGTASY